MELKVQPEIKVNSALSRHAFFASSLAWGGKVGRGGGMLEKTMER